jgi:hypothetical protein
VISGNFQGDALPLPHIFAPTIIPASIIPGNKKITLGWEQVHGVPSYKIYYKQTNDFSTAIEFSQSIPAASPVVTKDVLFYRAVAEYIYDKNKITPLLDGRIKIEGGVPLPPPWADSTWIPGTSE